MAQPATHTPILSVRVPRILQEMMQSAIDCRNAHTRNPPWTRSDFIVLAIAEKVDKMHRSRTQGGRESYPVLDVLVEAPLPESPATQE